MENCWQTFLYNQTEWIPSRGHPHWGSCSFWIWSLINLLCDCISI